MTGGRVILRNEIPDDMRGIIAYMDRDSAVAGEQFAHATFEAFEAIGANPGAGSLKEFRGRKYAGIRSWRVPGFDKYLVLYREIPQGVQVLGVAHGARLLKRFLDERL